MENYKPVDKMTLTELQNELCDLSEKYERLELMWEILKTASRVVTSTDLRKIKDYSEDVYKKDMESWGFLHGMRDNICDMADNLVKMQNVGELQRFNAFIYTILLDEAPKATDGLYTVTDGMKKVLFESMGKGEVA